MRYLLALFFAAACWAQNPVQFQPTTTDPTGRKCNSTQGNLKTPDGTLFTCQNGIMAKASTSGGAVTLAGDVIGPSGSNSIKASVGLTGTPTAPTAAGGDGTTQITSDAFVANALQAINPATNVQVSTTTVLPNSPAYVNTGGGVGATLTATTNGAFAAVDGYSASVGDRLLIQNQASTLQDGVYVVTSLGSGGSHWQLTRAADYNTVTNINYTGFICTIQTGSTYAGDTCFLLANLISAVGASAITYNQQAAGANAGKPGGGVQFTGNVTPGDVVIVAPGNSGKNIKDAGYAPTTCTAPQFLVAIQTCATPVLTQNSQSTAYTTVLGDAGKMLLHPSSDNNARTFTIDSNANVAYPIGTCLTFVNSINTLTIAITSDTMTLMGANTTGSRTMAAGNWATACKIASTSWVIGGSSGLT